MLKDTRRTSLVMCLADADENPRPNRMIRLLNDSGFIVDLLAFSTTSKLPIRNSYRINKPSSKPHTQLLFFLLNIPVRLSLIMGLNRLAEAIYETRCGLRNIPHPGSNIKYEIIIIEDLQLLPLAFRKFGGNATTKLVFDAREFYTKQKENELRFRLFEKPIRTYLCKKYLPQCSHLLTVSPGLARAYRSEFDLDMHVLRSAPYFHSMKVQPTPNRQIRMVHHGLASRNRGLNNMIEIVRRLDNRFTLDFYLVGKSNDISDLKKQAMECNRISFRRAVPLDKIVEMLNGYDIGFYYLEPLGLNVTYNLPNKFFEFIQGRLAIAIGPSPDMAELVRKYNVGFISQEFTIESMVETLSGLSKEKIDIAKKNSDAAANELCYEREVEEFVTELGKS